MVFLIGIDSDALQSCLIVSFLIFLFKDYLCYS